MSNENPTTLAELSAFIEENKILTVSACHRRGKWIVSWRRNGGSVRRVHSHGEHIDAMTAFVADVRSRA